MANKKKAKKLIQLCTSIKLFANSLRKLAGKTMFEGRDGNEGKGNDRNWCNGNEWKKRERRSKGFFPS